MGIRAIKECDQGGRIIDFLSKNEVERTLTDALNLLILDLVHGKEEAQRPLKNIASYLLKVDAKKFGADPPVSMPAKPDPAPAPASGPEPAQIKDAAPGPEQPSEAPAAEAPAAEAPAAEALAAEAPAVEAPAAEAPAAEAPAAEAPAAEAPAAEALAAAPAADEHPQAPELFDAVGEGDVDRLSALLEAGVPASSTDDEGNTALIMACEGETDCVRVLLEHGAPINHQNHEGTTALMAAVRYEDAELVSMLLAANADMQLANNEGDTATTMALEVPEVRCLLTGEELEPETAKAPVGDEQGARRNSVSGNDIKTFTGNFKDANESLNRRSSMDANETSSRA